MPEPFLKFPAVEFIHQNFSDFLKSPASTSLNSEAASALLEASFDEDSRLVQKEISCTVPFWSYFCIYSGISNSVDQLTKLLLELMKVNGSPLLDISLDISPRNSSRFVGVIRVPGRAAILPRLTHSARDFAIFKRWVRIYFFPLRSPKNVASILRQTLGPTKKCRPQGGPEKTNHVLHKNPLPCFTVSFYPQRRCGFS